MKSQIAFFALALAGNAFAQVSEQSDGQPTESPTTLAPTTYPTETPPPETTPTESYTESFGPYTISEADHTETVTLPIPQIPTSGWTSTVLSEPSYTETVPVPIGPTAPTEESPPATPPAPYTGTSAYIPPNPPVPSTGFTSVVISEAGATETVPVPETPTVTTPPETYTTPYTTPYESETSYPPEETTSVPYVAGGALQTPVMGVLAGALGFMAVL